MTGNQIHYRSAPEPGSCATSAYGRDHHYDEVGHRRCGGVGDAGKDPWDSRRARDLQRLVTSRSRLRRLERLAYDLYDRLAREHEALWITYDARSGNHDPALGDHIGRVRRALQKARDRVNRRRLALCAVEGRITVLFGELRSRAPV